MKNLCMNCMEEIKDLEGAVVCPFCNESLDFVQNLPFIPKSSIIGQRYIIGKGLKKDNESLSYIGYDFIKKTKVYIKECFPLELCIRGENGKIEISEEKILSKKYNLLLETFLKYFRGVARFRSLTSIISIFDILEENNTAYVISEWIEGKSFYKYINDEKGRLSWKEARIIFMPLISSLIKMSSSGIRHLGISPYNILLTNENKLKLTEFSTHYLRKTGPNIISPEIIKNYSSIEQYTPNAAMTESTDVFGLMSTLFFALTGEPPLCVLERDKKDKLLIASNILKELPENVVTAIANALRINQNDRTISFEKLMLELSNTSILKINDVYENNEKLNSKIKKNTSTFKKWGVISFVSSISILMICFGIYWFWIKDKNSSIDMVLEGSNLGNQLSLNSDDDNDNELESPKIDVPQLIGKELDEIKNSGSNEYTIEVLSEEFHDSIDEGYIISQTPSYGEKMYVESIIAVNVSKGSSKIVLPSIVGLSLSEASLALTKDKFIPIQVNEESNVFPQGTVIGYKDYKAGELQDYGSEIIILVSKG